MGMVDRDDMCLAISVLDSHVTTQVLLGLQVRD